MEFRSTFKRPWRSGREPVNRSFTACYDETTQLRGPGFAPPGVHLFLAFFSPNCPLTSWSSQAIALHSHHRLMGKGSLSLSLDEVA